MSISYSCIVGHGSGKVTLPSVESWGENMSMLRDPPKSIQTRKIDKVGETSEITQMIQESGDRVNEVIKVYARGVNPMVAVDYGGVQGTMGGQYYGGQTNAGTHRSQAFLPYRIADHGAIRASWRDQRDLIPLSRQPRVWTSSFTQPGFTDFSKSAIYDNTSGARSVKSAEMTLKACVRPTATYHLETPVVEPFEVKYVIKNPLHVAGHSGNHTTARFNGEIGEPVKQIVVDPLRPDIHTSRSDVAQNIDLSHFDTEKYTHEVLKGNVRSNTSRNIQATSIEDLFGMDAEQNIKETRNVSVTAPHKGYEKHEYISTEIELDRVLPEYNAYTNKGRNVHRAQENQIDERKYVPNRPHASATTNHVIHRMPAYDQDSDRSYVLRPTIQAGGFDPTPSMPAPMQENLPLDFSDKNALRQRAYEMQQDRNVSLGNIPYNPREIAQRA